MIAQTFLSSDNINGTELQKSEITSGLYAMEINWISKSRADFI